MVRKLIEVTDNMMEDAYGDYTFRGYAKAFNAGALEGLVDSAFILGLIWIVFDTINVIKKLFKKK